MHINFKIKRYGSLECQFDIKELPTNTQLAEIKKEVQERLKIAEEKYDRGQPWLEAHDICAEVLRKYVPIGHNTHIATIVID